LIEKNPARYWGFPKARTIPRFAGARTRRIVPAEVLEVAASALQKSMTRLRFPRSRPH
jgi:hypothetical protein